MFICLLYIFGEAPIIFNHIKETYIKIKAYITVVRKKHISFSEEFFSDRFFPTDFPPQVPDHVSDTPSTTRRAGTFWSGPSSSVKWDNTKTKNVGGNSSVFSSSKTKDKTDPTYKSSRQEKREALKEMKREMKKAGKSTAAEAGTPVGPKKPPKVM